MEPKKKIVLSPESMLLAICYVGFAPESIPEERFLANECLAICRERGFTNVQMRRGAANYLFDLMETAVPTIDGFLASCENARDWDREQAKLLRDQVYPDEELPEGEDRPDPPTTATHPWNADPKTRAEKLKDFTQDDTVFEFFESEGDACFENGSSPLADLFSSYQKWCEDNAKNPLMARTFLTVMKNNADLLGIKYDENLRPAVVRSFRKVGKDGQP